MRYLVLATDYDGTLASQGRVSEDVIDCLKRVRESGRKVMLVTGRHMPDLLTVFPKLELFDRVVVENGALLYRPETREEKLLCEPPDERFVKMLKDRGVPDRGREGNRRDMGAASGCSTGEHPRIRSGFASDL